MREMFKPALTTPAPQPYGKDIKVRLLKCMLDDTISFMI